jgi:hypothetical protein
MFADVEGQTLGKAFTQILSASNVSVAHESGNFWQVYWTVTALSPLRPGETIVLTQYDTAFEPNWPCKVKLGLSDEGCIDDPDVDPPIQVDPPDVYNYITEEGCELNVNFQAWGQMPDGTAGPIFLIEPAESTRASGGVIGGCNFYPTIVYSPGGGGGGGQPPVPIPVPYPPDPPGPDGKPLWQKLLEAALAGAVSGLVQNLFDETDKKLDQLLECACPKKPELARHWRSIRFQSDEPSPNSRTRLHKLFRYRGNSPGVVTTLADHWQGFRWITGPVCVYHKGSPLGTPQVWAATANEGQRVIRHAGREAGIDPDQIGEWGISSSDNSRYGVSLEVGLHRVDGCWSATARPGSDGWPEAGVIWPDP